MDINTLQLLSRLQNVFGSGIAGNDPSSSPISQQPPTMAPPLNTAPLNPSDVGGQQPPPQPSDIPNPLTSIPPFQPQTRMSGLYQQALSQMPQRPDASTLTEPDRINATMQGVAAGSSPLGISNGHVIGFKFNPQAANEASDQALYKGYYQKLQDWSDQIKPLGVAAAQEEKANIDARTAHDQKVNEAVKVAAEQEREKNDRDKLAVSQQRADAYSFDKQNPNLIKVAEPGSTLQFFDPKTGQMVKDTGIPSGKLSDDDRIALNIKGRLAEIAATGDQARTTEGVKEGDRQLDITARGDQARQTKQVPSGNQTGKDATQTQQKIGDYRRARQAVLDHPEWKPYIHLDTAGANTFTVDSPSGGHWYSSAGPDAATYKAIADYINNGPAPKVNVTPPPSGSSGQAPKPDEVRVQVRDKATGKVIATIPASDAPRLNTDKYEVVK